MAWADIKRAIRSDLGEPKPAFWTDPELQGWYNDAISMQHRAVWQALLQLEDRAFGEAMENDYARAFMAKSTSANLVAGTQDYAFPTRFWRALRVAVVVNGVECPCDFSPFADDWEVRTLPHRQPSPTRPKYTITPESKIRFYLKPGLVTAPNSTNAYFVFFMKEPLAVTIETGGAVDTEVADPFNVGPRAYVRYRAMQKQYDDGSPYLQEAVQAAQAIVPGPSKETREKKTVIIREVAAQGGG